MHGDELPWLAVGLEGEGGVAHRLREIHFSKDFLCLAGIVGTLSRDTLGEFIAHVIISLFRRVYRR